MRLITTHFNPSGYRSRGDNHARFVDALGPLADRLVTVEASFNGEQEIDGSILLKGGPKNFMWQKERLINHAISMLPGDVDKVCWLDADLLFQNPGWYEETVELLDAHPIVQCFSSIEYLNRQGGVEVKKPSWVFNYKQPGQGYRGPSGGAIAARRDVLGSGLDESQVVGGGDNLAIEMWTGGWDSYLTTHSTRAARHYSLRKAASDYQLVRGNLGMTTGTVQHMFHGTLERRRYVARNMLLKRHGFNPSTDIRVGSNRLLEWCSDKPKLHEEVRSYFESRMEDSL